MKMKFIVYKNPLLIKPTLPTTKVFRCIITTTRTNEYSRKLLSSLSLSWLSYKYNYSSSSSSCRRLWYYHRHRQFFSPPLSLLSSSFMRTAASSSSSLAAPSNKGKLLIDTKDPTNKQIIQQHHQHQQQQKNTQTYSHNQEERHWNTIFTNSQNAHGHKSIMDLIRSIFVLKSCQFFPFFIRYYGHVNVNVNTNVNADSLFQLMKTKESSSSSSSLSVLSSSSFLINNPFVYHTFYKQFCAGWNQVEIQSHVQNLNRFGIGAILDYAAEDDVNDNNDHDHDHRDVVVVVYPSSSPSSTYNHPHHNCHHHQQQQNPSTSLPTARKVVVYKYKLEQKYDHHVDTFLQCIRTVKACSDDNHRNEEEMSDTSSTSTSTSVQQQHHQQQNQNQIQLPGFAAIKVTALGNPLLLERVSMIINEARNIFHNIDHDRNGIVTRDEIIAAYTNGTYGSIDDNNDNGDMSNNGDDVDENVYHDTTTNTTTLSQLLYELDLVEETNRIDYITFISKILLLSPSSSSSSSSYSSTLSVLYTHHCKNSGLPSSSSSSTNALLTTEELDLFSKLQKRLDTIAKEASITDDVKLLIDAEHTKYQPGIDYLAFNLQRVYNQKSKTNVPIIFNTYQCYLKDVRQRLELDLCSSLKYKYHFGVKLVRGAYMVYENECARNRNVESPIFTTIEETHDCYNDIVEFLLKKKVECPKNKDDDDDDDDFQSLEIMCATHNQESIIKALTLMERLNIMSTEGESSPSSPSIHFAQLLGMSDNLTFPLGTHGYSVYKYVPYGKMDEVMPYLIRRAQENNDVLGNNATKEISLLLKELKRRIFY